ncbi:MAG: Gfo/Idh/MocA family oxidoreductase [Bacteroidales bacterium]|nr:Gfo/Idh/MocA family oxidoreductase [Bacteroidales bacterium]
MTTRRDFIRKTTLAATGITLGGLGMKAVSYKRIPGSNDRVRIGVIGFSDRFRYSLYPCFLDHAESLNMEIAAVSDIWSQRRDEAKAFLTPRYPTVRIARNNEELYEGHDVDAVIISTADFQHALHLAEAVNAGCDAYVEKPFAETMEDNRIALAAVQKSGRIVQVGSQRRSGLNYIAANDYIRSGKFGRITMVEMCWNVNQPGRWRRPKEVAMVREGDVDWKRYLMNRPFEPWDPRKYIEYRLFWPYSSGIPGQWMCHQIDTVHWFTGLQYPRSVAANGGIYAWQDGRTNADTMTAVFDYGPKDDPKSGFQVVYSSRMHNSAGGVKELYFSNGGCLNLDTNRVTPDGGLEERHAGVMNMEPNLLQPYDLPAMKAEAGANTGSDPMTSAHMRNWMECIRSRETPHADVLDGYHHSIAVIMTTAALHTGKKVTFDETKQEVMAGDVVFGM